MADAKYKYKDYEESDSVKAAKAALDSYAASKPTYSSKYQDSLKKAMDRILNREKFSYDLNGDMLYQQYKDQYTNLGKAAMKDTMGQAAMLTGGYSNSYANTAGAQAYQGYLGQLNDRIPELYSLALDKYDREGNDLLNQYSLLYDRENQDYSRYRDAVGDYETALGYLADRYDTERSYDYGRYGDDRAYDYQAYRDGISDSQWQKNYDEDVRQYNQNYDYQLGRDAVSDAQWQRDYDYQLGRDAVSDAQWRAEFDEAKRQYDADLAEKQRQYDADLTEKQRQYDADIVYKMTKDSTNSKTSSKTDVSDDFDYSDWDGGDWESYFAYIRQTEGTAAAEYELKRLNRAGLIPAEYVVMASSGARGSLKH